MKDRNELGEGNSEEEEVQEEAELLEQNLNSVLLIMKKLRRTHDRDETEKIVFLVSDSVRREIPFRVRTSGTNSSRVEAAGWRQERATEPEILEAYSLTIYYH